MCLAGCQRGMVLILSLVFALLLALLTAMLVQTATQQLHMAGNTQLRAQMREYALSIVTFLVRSPQNFRLDTEVGHINCMPASQASDCDSRTLTIPTLEAGANVLSFHYRVIRRAPLVTALAPSREQGKEKTEDTFFASFEIDVRVVAGPAIAHVIQGIAVELAHPLNMYYTYWREPGVDPL